MFTNGSLNCYNSNTTQLTVKPNIQFSLTPISKLCFNQTLNVNGPTGATSYTWTGPGFTSNTQNLYLPNASTINIGTYYLAVDLNGCTTYGSIFVDVHDPIIWKNVPNTRTLCKGDSFTITAEAGNGSGNYAYNWSPYYNITGPTGSVQTGYAQGTTVYNISVYDIACPTYTINHTFALNVNSAPKPLLSIPNNQCEPFCTIYDSKIKNTTETVAYTFNGGNTYYGDSTNICLSAGDYTLNITSFGLNGCKETFQYPSVIKVYPKPNADFNWTPNNPNTVSESQVTFHPVGQSNSSSWLWELGANIISTDKNPVQNYDVQGNYAVTFVVTTEHGCKDTVTKVLEIRDEFLLFIPNAFSPNGDGNNDVFKPKGLGIKTFDLSIFDRWGSLIFQSNELNRGWDGTFKGLYVQDGVYVYKVAVIDQHGMKHERTGHVTLMK